MLKSKQSCACSYSTLVSVRHDFKSHAATVAEPDQNPSGIMFYRWFVCCCTRLGPLVSSKINPHDSLPTAGFSEARETQSLKRGKDECNDPKGMKHERVFRFLFLSGREVPQCTSALFMIPKCSCCLPKCKQAMASVASAVRMQKFEPEREKSDKDFGRTSLSWKTNPRGFCVYEQWGWGFC